MPALAKYTAIFSQSVKQSLHVPVGIVANAAITTVRLFFLFVIYTYTYSHVGGAVAIPLSTALAALALYNILLMLNLRRVFDVITKDIKSGMFEVSYLRPMSYLLGAAAARLGLTITIASTTAPVALVLFIIFSPELPQTLGYGMFAWGIVLAVLGVALSGFMYTLIALPALWINDAEPFYYILDKVILILGGAYVPVILFPGWLQAVAEYTPFGAVMAGTRMFDPDFLAAAPLYALIQVFWILVFYGAVTITMYAARKHIAINGG